MESAFWGCICTLYIYLKKKKIIFFYNTYFTLCQVLSLDFFLFFFIMFYLNLRDIYRVQKAG